ncbi:MAG TPA: glycosyltransferase family 9 protein [Ignavibacteria bacterium]|nr:glycosyltransferase family 9 protein [Ignavibacteria bacterium]
MAPIPDKNSIKKILVVRTDRIGDVILTLPLIYQIKKILPHANVSILVSQNVAELLYDYEIIDEVIILENIKNLKMFFKRICYDLVINAFPVFDISRAEYLSKVPLRIGTAYRWYSFLYNIKIHEHRKECLLHEYQYNVNLLKKLYPEAGYDFKYSFKINETEESLLNEKLQKYLFNINDEYIIIHPSSGGSSIDVSEDVLVDFINKFQKNNNIKIAITGKISEKNFNSKIENKNNIIDLSGELNLRELLILINNSKLFIANSTGPIHIAGALNKKIIGFYPEQKPMNETRWGPLNESKIILRPDVASDQILNSANNLLAK